MSFFVAAYGTLRSPRNTEALLGRKVPSRLGAVAGWRVCGLSARPYPGIFPSPYYVEEVDVLGPLSSLEFELLCAWERDYERVSVVVFLVGGGQVDAFLWVPRTGDPGLLPSGLWDLVSWESTFLEKSRAAAVSFRQRFLSSLRFDG